jgi:hypothetical protein
VVSAFVDDEAGAAEAAQLQAHLRECSHCRAKVRAYRAAPRAAAMLLPAVPTARSLGERLHDLAAAAGSRLPARTGAAETAVGQLAAAGGSRGTGMALAAKVLAACLGTAGGAACVAAGVIPPAHLGADRGPGAGAAKAAHTRPARIAEAPATTTVVDAPDPVPEAPPAPEPVADSAPPPPAPPPPPAEFTPEAPPSPAVGQASAATEFGGSGGGAGGGGGSASAPSRTAEFGP